MKTLMRLCGSAAGNTAFVVYWLLSRFVHEMRERLFGIIKLSCNDLIRKNTLSIPPATADSSLTLCFAGDLIFEDKILRYLDRICDREDSDPDRAVKKACLRLFEEIRPWLSGDIVCGNLETVLAGNYGTRTAFVKGRKISLEENVPPYRVHYPGVYEERLLPLLNNRTSFAQALREAGFNYLSTANNHSEDRLSNGIDLTIEALDSAGISHSGTFRYKDIRTGNSGAADACPYIIIERNGIKTAFFSYTRRQNPFFPDFGPVNRAGQVCRFAHPLRPGKISQSIPRWIKHARNTGKADIVVVSAHWGIENNHYVCPSQLRGARTLCEAGADLVIGHHPHALQPAEILRAEDGRLCAVIYSAGNFTAGIDKKIHRLSALFYAAFRRGPRGAELCGLEYLPTATVHEKSGIKVMPARLCADAEELCSGAGKIISGGNIKERKI